MTIFELHCLMQQVRITNQFFKLHALSILAKIGYHLKETNDLPIVGYF